MSFALDCSAGRPTAAQVKAAGYVGVIRYIGFPANRKCITAAEYADMTSAGVGVALVYEQTAGDALGGRPAGRAGAALAKSHAATVGYPANLPIYMACDTDIVSGLERARRLAEVGMDTFAAEHRQAHRPLTASQMDAVLDYCRGAGDVLGGPHMVGIYGEFDVIERCAVAGVAEWFWQTRAWSGGRLSAHAHLRQEIGTYVVGGIDCDRNTILKADWGQTGTTEEGSLSATDADRVIAAVHDAVDVLYNLARAQTPDGKPDPGHAEMAVTTANSRLSALGAALAKIGTQVGALSDDEAKLLAATDAATAKILAAVQTVIVDPQVPNADPDAFVAALRDALVRGEPPA
jgi:hypothetical protein